MLFSVSPKAVGNLKDRVQRAGFGAGMAGIGYDAEVCLGPSFVQIPRVFKRGADIIAAMDDCAGDRRDFVDIGKQLLVAVKKAAMDKVMAFDTGEGQGIVIAAKQGDAGGIGEQGDCLLYTSDAADE